MIKSVENKDIVSVVEFCSDSLLGTKIACLLKAYGVEYGFFNIWYLLHEDKIAAVISLFDDNITLLCDKSCDYGQIKIFIDMLGYKTIMCDETDAMNLKFSDCRFKNSYTIDKVSDVYITDDISHEFYKVAYKLICDNIPDSFENSDEAYLSFLSDFTYRKSRSLARFKGITEQGSLLSCAMTSAETDIGAIISGVASDKTVRKTGLGKRVVLSLASELLSENKKVYVIALNESAEGFYEHIGFKKDIKVVFFER